MPTYKEDEILRVCFQNINSYGASKGTSKGELVNKFIKDNALDAFLLAEVNVNWRKVPKLLQMRSIVGKAFERQHVCLSYNRHSKLRTHALPGGTAIICTGETSLRKLSVQEDSLHLGRWNSILLRGKNNMRLRLVSVYVPTPSSQVGYKQIYIQQQEALGNMRDKSTPLAAFWRDFWVQIDEWLSQGEQLVIGGDWNQNVTHQTFQQKFRERNLIPCIVAMHGDNAPATFHSGSKPIDEIFVSSTIKVSRSGYMAHGDGPGDHRPIWIDIDKGSVLGSKLPPLPSFSARRLKCNDPRVVDKYNQLLFQQLEKNHVPERVEALFHNFSTPLTEAQIKEYETLDHLRELAMIHAEKHCRHLFMGSVRWSPLLQRSLNMKIYLRSCISRLKGTNVSARTLLRQSKKANFSAEGMKLEELLLCLDEANKDYNKIKKNHDIHRKDYLEGLAEAMEENGKGSKATHLRNLIRLEDQRDMYRRLKYVHGKVGSLSTSMLTVSDHLGNKKDIVDKTEMEEAIMHENVSKYHQTEATCPFITDPVLRFDFGAYGEGPQTLNLFNGLYNPPDHLDDYTKAFLLACRYPVDVAEAPFTRTAEIFADSWKYMKERTVSDPGAHFGHYKPAAKDPLLNDVHYYMAEIPFRSGYSPTRYKNGTNSMILKEE